MSSLALDLSRTLASAVVTAAALAGCAGGACRARCSASAAPCSFATSPCSGKKCAACSAKKCGAKK